MSINLIKLPKVVISPRNCRKQVFQILQMMQRLPFKRERPGQP